MAEQSWDVVVVGSGAAGLMACLELPPHLRVLLLSKDQDPPGDARTIPRSASRWAQGGVAAVTRPNDSFTSHSSDTLRAGAGLCDRAAVERLVQGEPGPLRRGLERLGTSSLSAYAVHQLALSRQQPVLGWGAYWAATAGLLAFTYVAVLGVERAEATWARRRAATAS